jgi:hypothetical protein
MIRFIINTICLIASAGILYFMLPWAFSLAPVQYATSYQFYSMTDGLPFMGAMLLTIILEFIVMGIWLFSNSIIIEKMPTN